MRTILVADPVRRLDNILDVAVAAKAVMVLVLVLGLTASIPLVVFGSTRMIRQMERFFVAVTLGHADWRGRRRNRGQRQRYCVPAPLLRSQA